MTLSAPKICINESSSHLGEDILKIHIWQGADIKNDRKNSGGVDRGFEQMHHKEGCMNGQ